MAIAVDIDDVLLKEPWEKLGQHFITCGYQFDRPVFLETHDWKKATGCSQGVLDNVYKNFVSSTACPPPTCIPGASGAIQLLCQKWAIHIVTSRSGGTRALTLKILARHFGSCFTSCHFGPSNTKPPAIARCGAGVMIEDNLRNAQKITPVARVIVFPQQTNYRHARNPQLVYTQAHPDPEENLTKSTWQQLWQEAWEEIPHLVRDLLRSPRVISAPCFA